MIFPAFEDVQISADTNIYLATLRDKKNNRFTVYLRAPTIQMARDMLQSEMKDYVVQTLTHDHFFDILSNG